MTFVNQKKSYPHWVKINCKTCGYKWLEVSAFIFGKPEKETEKIIYYTKDNASMIGICPKCYDFFDLEEYFKEKGYN